MTEEIKVTIAQWEKYQLRKDIKSPWWCAIDNELWRADEFSTFSPEEKVVWYALLQIASKARRSDLTFKTLWVARCSGVQPKSVKNCVLKAKNLGWLYETRTEPVRNPSPTLHDMTRYKTLVQKPKTPLAPLAELESVYLKYPRKAGKKAGMRLLSKIPPEKIPLVEKAISNYRAEIDKMKTEEKFIKHFSSFMNCWEDYLNKEVKASVGIICG